MGYTIRSILGGLICLLLLGSTSAFARIIGDVDRSGDVNATDVQLTINAAICLQPDDTSADINGDLKVNAADVQLSINAVLGRPVDIVCPPAADFQTSTPTMGLLPLKVVFWDVSDPGDAPISSWLWEFGDGATSTDRHPTHTYTAEGKFTVRLTVRAGAQASRCIQRSFVSVADLRVTSFAVNNGDEVTTSRVVTLNNTCVGNPAQFTRDWAYSPSPPAVWEAYSTAPTYTIPVQDVDGVWQYGFSLTVRDAEWRVSAPAYDTIRYDTGNITGRDRTYEESHCKRIRDMQRTADGLVILAVGTYSQISEAGMIYWYSDSALIKTDAGGAVEWTKIIDVPENNKAHSVQQTLDGGYVVAGQILRQLAGSAAQYEHVHVAKTDAAGNLEWSQAFGGSADDKAEDIKQTTDGGYIVAGTSSSPELERGLFLLKLDGDGRQVWAKGFEETLGLEGSFGRAVVETPDGGYLLTGEADIGIWSNVGIPLVKTDSEGNLLWWRFLQPRGELCIAVDIQPTPDGGYALVGLGMEEFGGMYAYMLLAKIDAEGNLIWSRNLFQGYSGHAFTQTSDGGFVVAGSKIRQPEDLWNWRHTAVVKTDSEGNVIWRRAQGSYLLGVPYAVQETADGNYAVAGERLDDSLTPEQEGGSFWFQMDPYRNYVELAK